MDVPTTIMVKGIEMIYIPAGEFLMGSNEGMGAEKPPHYVHVNGFYIARYPVTNAQYREIVAAKAYHQPSRWKAGTYPKGSANHPVVYVSWWDALAYCRWLSEEMGQETRLPTEAQWEKAARGSDRRRYPWGNLFDKFDKPKCNTKESRIGGTTPVGTYSPQGDSPYGVGDMAGNVCEWTSSLYKHYPYNRDDGRERISGGDRVVRGGSFAFSRWDARCAYRSWPDPDHRYSHMGFRVVVSPVSPE